MQFESIKFEVMKRNAKSLTLIISVLLLATVIVFGFDSCKKKKTEPEKPIPNEPWSPEPVNGELPTSVLPEELKDVIDQSFTIYSGDNPVKVVGQFVSSPHALMATSLDTTYVYPDSVIFYNDRYICFERTSSGNLNFYGKQWDDDYEEYYEEVYRELNSVGDDDNFTCYFLTEGYPNGMYALQSTIFSGRWDESYGGLKDFQVAVILLENSGNPNLAPVNSYRVLGDFDGLAQDTSWMKKKAMMNNDVKVSEHDAFWMFRVK